MLDSTPERKPRKPRRKLLTEDSVLPLDVDAKPYRVWDSKGALAVRGLPVLVSPLGTKTHRAQYRNRHGRQGAVKLGRVGELDLDEARTMCREVRRQVYRGQAPRVSKVKGGATFKELVERRTREEQVGAKETPVPTVRSSPCSMPASAGIALRPDR